MSLEAYWLVAPSIGAVCVWGLALVLWLTRPRRDGHKPAE